MWTVCASRHRGIRGTQAYSSSLSSSSSSSSSSTTTEPSSCFFSRSARSSYSYLGFFHVSHLVYVSWSLLHKSARASPETSLYGIIIPRPGMILRYNNNRGHYHHLRLMTRILLLAIRLFPTIFHVPLSLSLSPADQSVTTLDKVLHWMKERNKRRRTRDARREELLEELT